MTLEILQVGPLATNCCLCWDEETGAGVLVDPGEDATRILEAVRSRNVRVTHILLTHGHFDHITALPEMCAATGAAVCVHAADAHMTQNPQGSLYTMFYGAGRRFTPVIPDRLLQDGDVIEAASVRFYVLHTPGHTPGSVCYDTGEVLISGDTLFEDDCGRCDLPGGDYAQMMVSLRRLHDLTGDRSVYPGHGPATTLSRERIHNTDMRRAVGDGI